VTLLQRVVATIHSAVSGGRSSMQHHAKIMPQDEDCKPLTSPCFELPRQPERVNMKYMIACCFFLFSLADQGACGFVRPAPGSIRPSTETKPHPHHDGWCRLSSSTASNRRQKKTLPDHHSRSLLTNTILELRGGATSSPPPLGRWIVPALSSALSYAL